LDIHGPIRDLNNKLYQRDLVFTTWTRWYYHRKSFGGHESANGTSQV